MFRSSNKSFLVALVLTSLTLLSGFALSSVRASADEVVDEIEITVPVSCTLSGVGMDSHTTSLMNGNYASNVGTTTLTAFCNDNDGFAIYAVGFTDDTDGKTVMTSSALDSDYDIPTGTLTSGNNSQWAMKLATQTSPEPTYPISIENNYNNYHTVPDDYELVAKRTSATDTGTNAIGSVLTSTYQIYVSTLQPAGTYIGKVKYVMVHPNNTEEIPVREDQVAILFDGNGLTFPGGATTNRVVYGTSCTPMYMSTTPEVVETSNLTNGVQSGSYSNSENVLYSNTFNGASKVRVVVDYGITGNTAELLAIDDVWDGDWDNYNEDWNDNWIYNDSDITGTKTYTFDGDTVTIFSDSWDNPVSDYNYGFYARVYPIYATEQTGTEEASICEISSTPVSGAYAETTIWKGKWYTTINNELVWFENQSAIFNYVSKNSSDLLGSTLKYYAYYPFTIYYDGNSATSGTMNGFYTFIDTSDSTSNLMAYNFKKTGYGFAGWSADPNATVNSYSKIYGPNEMLSGDELSFDNNREVTLYAVWVPSAGNLQNWSGCPSMTIGQVTALTDTRDNNVYTIGKLADGNCWMMENLRLDNNASLTSSNTNISTVVFNKLPASSDNWCYQCQNQALINTNNTNLNNPDLVAAPGGSYEEDSGTYGKNYYWFGYGNYYNWYSATGGTGTSSVTSGNVSGDICPNGWSMPTGGPSGQYINLYNIMSGLSDDYVDFAAYPTNYVFNGFWHPDIGAYNRGLYGFYYSKTAYNFDNAYTVSVGNNSFMHLVANDNLSRTMGHAVRCRSL